MMLSPSFCCVDKNLSFLFIFFLLLLLLLMIGKNKNANILIFRTNDQCVCRSGAQCILEFLEYRTCSIDSIVQNMYYGTVFNKYYLYRQKVHYTVMCARNTVPNRHCLYCNVTMLQFLACSRKIPKINIQIVIQNLISKKKMHDV